MRYIRELNKLLLQAADFAAHGEVRRSLLKDSPQEAPGVQVHLELLTAVTMCYRIWYWETLESSLLFASCVTLAKTLNHFRSWQSTSHWPLKTVAKENLQSLHKYQLPLLSASHTKHASVKITQGTEMYINTFLQPHKVDFLDNQSLSFKQQTLKILSIFGGSL